MPDTGAPHNLPYPEGADAPNVPADLQALAQATNDAIPWIQSGTTSATGDGTDGAAVAFAVTFPTPFAAAPSSILLSTGDSRYNVSVNQNNAPTPTGFSGFIRHLGLGGGNSATVAVMWTAIA